MMNERGYSAWSTRSNVGRTSAGPSLRGRPGRRGPGTIQVPNTESVRNSANGVRVRAANTQQYRRQPPVLLSISAHESVAKSPGIQPPHALAEGTVFRLRPIAKQRHGTGNIARGSPGARDRWCRASLATNAYAGVQGPYGLITAPRSIAADGIIRRPDRQHAAAVRSGHRREPLIQKLNCRARATSPSCVHPRSLVAETMRGRRGVADNPHRGKWEYPAPISRGHRPSAKHRNEPPAR